MGKPMHKSDNRVAFGSGASAGSEERVASLFGSDPLLAAQMLQTMRRKTLLEPETKLMIAILQDAIDSFQTNLLADDARSTRIFNEAAGWISARDTEWVFSFENICDHLSLDPSYVRQGLMRWMSRELAKRRTRSVYERKKMVG